MPRNRTIENVSNFPLSEWDASYYWKQPGISRRQTVRNFLLLVVLVLVS
jgi:hypothetical protein